MNKSAIIYGAGGAVGYNLLIRLLKDKTYENVILLDQLHLHIAPFIKSNIDENIYILYKEIIKTEEEKNLLTENMKSIIFPSIVISYDMKLYLNDIIKKYNVKVIYNLVEDCNPYSTYEFIGNSNIKFHLDLFYNISTFNHIYSSKYNVRIITPIYDFGTQFDFYNSLPDKNGFLFYSLKLKEKLTEFYNKGNNYFGVVSIPNILDININKTRINNPWRKALDQIKFKNKTLDIDNISSIFMKYCTMNDAINSIVNHSIQPTRNKRICKNIISKESIYLNNIKHRDTIEYFNQLSLVKFLCDKYKYEFKFYYNISEEYFDDIWNHVNINKFWKIFKLLNDISNRYMEIPID